jgi:co-chaperonin GroES (HSP10)
MKPISKYILLNHIEEELKTESGILLSGDEAQKRRYHKGKVVSVGEEVKAIAKDDVVYYDHRGAHTLIIEGIKITVIQERDVVIVL